MGHTSSMTGVLIKSGSLDTETQILTCGDTQGEDSDRTGVMHL